MAQVQANTNDPNDPNNLAAQPQNLGTNQPAPPATSAGAGPVTATGAANVTGQVVGTANPSQPFQNIASYLAANAPQSASLANQVAGTVSQPIAQTASDIANASQNFQNSVNAGYTPENTALDTSVAANPVAAAADPNNVAAFQAQLNDAYTGPTDMTTTPGYSNLQTEVANAQAQGQAAQTPTGIQTLLQGTEAPNYTQGINNLDTLLLAQNPQNFQTIQNAGLPANTTNNALGNFLDTQATQGNAAAQAALANAQAASGAAGTALTGPEQALTKTLNDEMAAGNTSAQKFNTDLANYEAQLSTPATGLLQPGASAPEGISPDMQQILTALAQFNSVNPSEAYQGPSGLNYLSSNQAAVPPTMAQAATSEDVATALALQQLSGGSYTPPVTATEPWSIPAQPTFNNAGLANDLYSYLNANPMNFANVSAGPAVGESLKAYYSTYEQLQRLLGLPAAPPPSQPGYPESWPDPTTGGQDWLPPPAPVAPPSGPPYPGLPGGDVNPSGRGRIAY